jgi:hypothetical protein
MVLAAPGNMSNRKAVDIQCNLWVSLEKEWIGDTIRVHVHFGSGVNPLRPLMFRICEFQDMVNFSSMTHRGFLNMWNRGGGKDRSRRTLWMYIDCIWNRKEGRLKTNKKVSPMKWKGMCGDQTNCVSLWFFLVFSDIQWDSSDVWGGVVTSFKGHINGHLPADTCTY